MKRFFILFLMFALSVPVMGRKHPDVPQAYAYGSSIDIQGGFVGMPYSISGDAGKAFGIGDGGEFQLRYSYFFRRHWGIFTSFSLLGTGVDDIDYFGTVNKADGGRYRYGSAPYELNCVGAGSNPYGRNNGFFGAAFQVGIAYRYDFGGWSLRPMLGIGIGSRPENIFSYRQTPRDGSAASAVSYHTAEYHPDYLDEPVSDHSSVAAVLSAAVQLTYTFNRHFYISFECGVKSFPNGTRYEKTVYQYKKAVEPANWAESVALSELENRYVVDMDSGISTTARLPFNFLDINFGIGWNIGRNRHQSGRYSK